jgi:hypothetical protein
MCRQIKKVFSRPTKGFVKRYTATGHMDFSQYVLTVCPCGLRRYWCLESLKDGISFWYTGLERKDRCGVCEWQHVPHAEIPEAVLDAAYAAHARKEDAKARREAARRQRAEERRASQPTEAQRRLDKVTAALKRWQRKRKLADTMIKKLTAKVRRCQRAVDAENGGSHAET